MIIRKAKQSDFNTLYRIGRSTPELRVSGSRAFMSKNEFRYAIKNKNGLLLCAEDLGRIVGFTYASIENPEEAAMLYGVVTPRYRGKGVSSMLTKRSEQWLKLRRIKSVYALATTQKVARILGHWGYKKGKRLIWMDKRL